MVNRLVWMGLPEHECILWGRLGDIEKVYSTSPRVIERVILEAQKAIEGAKVEIELAEEMDQIMFYRTSTRRHLAYCSGLKTDILEQIEIWLGNW